MHPTDAAVTQTPPPKTLLQSLGSMLRDPLLLILLAVLAAFSVFAPGRIASYPTLVDWPTIAALTGLLVLTKGLELSGGLTRLGAWLMGLMATERAIALCLVSAAALLSTLLTNDVALFVVVPLTLGICRATGMPVARLVIFEALAVNAGSALTPIGNPQNIFLWQLSGVSFGSFALAMLPLVTLLMLALLGLTFATFRNTNALPPDTSASTSMDSAMLWLSLALYLPFLVAADLHYAVWGAAIILFVLIIARPRVLAQVDWALLLVFVLMFIDLRLFAALEIVQNMMARLDLAQPLNLYFTAVAASQVISNVPAAIALAEYSKDWRVLAYGVNVGGFGLLIGSLANLIALRLAGDRKAWLQFHFYAVPFLAVATLLGYWLLR